MSLFKKLLGQTALYGLSSILGRTLNFLLTPILVAQLTVAQFGVSVDIYSIVAFLNIIYLFGLETTYFRFAKQLETQEQKTFDQLESMIIMIALFLSLFLVLFAHPISEYLEYPDRSIYIYLLAAILLTDALVAIPFARLRLANKAKQFAGIKIFNILLNMGLVIFFIVFCKNYHQSGSNPYLLKLVNLFYTEGDDVKYVFGANLIANASLLLIFHKSFTQFSFGIDKTLAKSMLKYAYPLVILGLAGMMNEMLSRMIFKKVLPSNFYPGYSEQEALGIFGACYKISMFMSLAIQSFRYAAEPFFFNQAKEKNSPQTFANLSLWFVVSCMLLFLMISINLDWIGNIMLPKSDYQQGLVVVPFLLLSSMLLGLCFNINIAFKLTNNTIYNTYISIAGLGITIVGNLALIPVMGYTGSAISSLLCYLTMVVLSYWAGQKVFPVPYPIFNMVVYTLIPIALLLTHELIPLHNYFFSFFYSVVATLIYLIVVFGREKRLIFIMNKMRTYLK